MKSTGILIAVAALMIPALTSAQKTFEGTVKGVMKAGEFEVEIVQHARNAMVRQDMDVEGAGKVTTIGDSRTGKLLMVVHQEKMWMDMAMMSMFMPGGGGANKQFSPDVELPDIRRTDRVETIAGYECRHYIIDNSAGDVDVCAYNGLGCFIPGSPFSLGGGGMSERARNDQPTLPALPQKAELWLEEFGDGFFILSMSAVTEQGDVSFRVTELELKTLSDDLFKPPADYTEMTMRGMGR